MLEEIALTDPAPDTTTGDIPWNTNPDPSADTNSPSAQLKYNSDAQRENEVTDPAAMLSRAEEAMEQNAQNAAEHTPTIDKEHGWNQIKEGVTEHERSTFQIFIEAQQTGGIEESQRTHEPSGGEFFWMTAIEGSTIPQLNVDQMDWTQHYAFWKPDLRRVRTELGIKYLRVSPPWYKINPAPGIYDWAWWDEYVEYAVGALGFDLMVDLVHFGTPLWMLEQFGNRDFAPRLADYAGEFARRYKGAIRGYCAINEPYITALFGGDLGCWPPYHTGQQNFPPMMSNITRGIIDASLAIRAEQPDALMMFIDTTENAWSPDADLDGIVAERNERRFISYDMALGKVDNNHPLIEWLLRNNMRESDIRYFMEHPAPVDVIGLDYYPQSEAILRVKPGGGYNQKDMMGAKLVDRLWDTDHIADENRDWPIGFYGVAKVYQKRYGLPITLAETNWCGGPIEHRLRWMDFTLAECRRLRAEGFPLVGYCWWGAYDHMDWGLALRLHSGKVHPVGLWNLVRKNWVLQRTACPLLDRYRHVIHHTEETVGSFPLRADELLKEAAQG